MQTTLDRLVESMQLAKLLVRKGILPESELGRLAEAQAAAPLKMLHEILIERGFAKEEAV